jgi:hypothetical protein
MSFVEAVSMPWQKSPFCAGGGCVEVAFAGDQVAMRDSKLADSPVLRFTREEWDAFAEAVKKDAFVD